MLGKRPHVGRRDVLAGRALQWNRGVMRTVLKSDVRVGLWRISETTGGLGKANC